MKKILAICSLCIGSITINAQINTRDLARDMAKDICDIITEETSVKKDIDGFHVTLGNATNRVFDKNKDAINNFFLLNPQYNSTNKAQQWGRETGYEISHHLMCNCTIYQEVILNNGNEIPPYSKLTEEVGNSIEAKVRAKSTKKLLDYKKCKKIMNKEIKNNRHKIAVEFKEDLTIFAFELQFYLLTQTNYFSKAAIIQMNKNHNKL